MNVDGRNLSIMTKLELVERVFKDNRFRKIPRTTVERMLDDAFELVKKSIQKDGKFTYPGFGSFVLRKRKARKGRSPQNGEPIVIKARRTVVFKSSPQLKDSLQ